MGKNCRVMRFQPLGTSIAAFHLGVVTYSKCCLVGSCLVQTSVANWICGLTET